MSNEKNVHGSNILSPAEYRRLQHQINLPEVGLIHQEEIKLAKVLVFGAGGLGAQILQLLAASGIGHITIVDDELVSEKNVQLQTLYGGNDLGKLKTIIAKQNLQNLFPFTEFEILNLKLNLLNNDQFISGNEIVIDATNTEDSHYIINDICVKRNLSWIYGHINGFDGEISVFNFSGGPSYKCLYPVPQININRDSASSLGIVYGTVGCLMVNECLKVIFKSNTVLSGKILNLNLYTNLFTQQSIDRIETNFTKY